MALAAYTLHVMQFTTSTYTDTGDIYKKGKKVRKYKGEVYRSTGVQGSNRGCFGYCEYYRYCKRCEYCGYRKHSDIAVETGRHV